ncbi:MAG: ABC transporter ATP-binding protein [Gammaproteobacteria bacterium]|nr:ABC transporter ATP-binding protein [Gammaproteobacteria bacterium]
MSENEFSATPWLDPAAKPIVQISNLTKQYDDATAVDNIDLNIYAGELFAILGGSGSGKTTLLRMLAGFERPTAGRILIDGADMTSVAPYERPVNMMFQSYALFPHMNVKQNVAYGLRKDRVPATQIKERVQAMLDMVKLSALANRKPHRLSGGERQRVALARALVKRPKLLLLDEPLAALDKKLREHTQFELMNLQDELGITFIVVTHDQEEAMTLSTRIAVMNDGRFEQVGTPGEVYEYPANRFIADFVGTINLLEAKVIDSHSGRVRLQCDQAKTELVAEFPGQPASDRQHWVAVRPEKIFIDKEPPSADDRTVLKGVVLDLGYFGNLSLYRVQLAGGLVLQVSAQNRRRSAVRTLEWDDEVYISWDIASAILLSE